MVLQSDSSYPRCTTQSSREEARSSAESQRIKTRYHMGSFAAALGQSVEAHKRHVVGQSGNTL